VVDILVITGSTHDAEQNEITFHNGRSVVVVFVVTVHHVTTVMAKMEQSTAYNQR
jgi:hypothetical protein